MRRSARNSGFTLLELLVASVAAAILLAALYGVYVGAIKMRDRAAARSKATTLQERATSIIRNDLENGLISGGVFASTLAGDSEGSDGNGDSGFPGYLKFTATVGKDILSTSGTQEMYGDVAQVEYYVVRDTNAGGGVTSGNLMRVVTRDLLDSSSTVVHQQQILTGVQSFQVSFYDGSQWQTSWQITGTNGPNSNGTGSTPSTSASTTSSSTSSGTSGSGTATTLPEAVMIDIQQAPEPGATQLPPPIEIVVPWTTTPFLSGTNYSIGSDTSGSGTTGQ
ncbi:MAG TPA: type II secretion system protein GspJ [Chthoniobacteraceae bacterium]|nr:type II secretion system protein GspJ [Chthoniobacteraceae bacterium]